MKSLFSILFIITIFFLNAASAANSDLNKIYSSIDLRSLVHQYMSQVFGAKAPTVKDYYLFEGPHSEDEYGMEIQECKRRWGNPQKLDDEAYALQMPKECLDWIVERDANRDHEDSLYYKSMRRRFNNFPLKYEVTSIKLTDHGYIVNVSVLEQKAVIVLNVYSLKLANTDPEIVIIAIKDIR